MLRYNASRPKLQTNWSARRQLKEKAANKTEHPHPKASHASHCHDG